jgi:hypothetical protein
MQKYKEGANGRAWRVLMIVLAAVVVLSVSGYGTVIYIQLMGKVFPSGPLQIACYMGAAANFLLMVVLLVGKFVWFRPGAHEVASWLVTGIELVVAILNMMLAFQLASGQPVTGFMAAWSYLAPISPIFSMCGAIALIMTSTEMRRRHKAMEVEEEKEQAENELGLAMHRAQIETRSKYVQFVTQRLMDELNSPARQQEMASHASGLVSKVLAEMSLLQAVPARPGLPAPQVPYAYPMGPVTGPLENRSVGQGEMVEEDEEMLRAGVTDEEAEEWLRQVNQRVAQERARRVAVSEDGDRAVSVAVQEVERMRRIVEAARARGYDVDRLAERFLGIPLSERVGESDEERLLRLARLVELRGYRLSDVERLVGLSTERGEDAKKK